MTRVALIHALAHSVAPINGAFEREWADCVRMNLLDDSLSADLARSDHGLDEAMTARFVVLGNYAVGTGAQGILFTCSAFGPCIDAVARRHPGIPVLKPNEAMIADAVALGRRIALIASFGPTLDSMPAEFPASVEVVPILAEGALEALDRGDGAAHDRLVADAARRAVGERCDVVALAQFSLARAAPIVRSECGRAGADDAGQCGAGVESAAAAVIVTNCKLQPGTPLFAPLRSFGNITLSFWAKDEPLAHFPCQMRSRTSTQGEPASESFSRLASRRSSSALCSSDNSSASGASTMLSQIASTMRIRSDTGSCRT